MSSATIVCPYLMMLIIYIANHWWFILACIPGSCLLIIGFCLFHIVQIITCQHSFNIKRENSLFTSPTNVPGELVGLCCITVARSDQTRISTSNSHEKHPHFLQVGISSWEVVDLIFISITYTRSTIKRMLTVMPCTTLSCTHQS